MIFFRYICSIMLTVALFFSNLGLAVTIHYCGKNIEKVVLGYEYQASCDHNTEAETSCCKETKKDKKCCADEVIKQQKDKVVQLWTLQFSPCILYTSYQWNLQNFAVPKVLINHIFEYTVQANAPPLYKKYHQYLLYA